jgi:hypothetical protein
MTHVSIRWAGACVAMYVAYGGHPLETTAQAPREIRIEVADVSRPVADAVSQVESQFGRVVTYEDGSYVAPGDIVDITARIRTDGKLSPRVLGRRRDSISLVYTPRQASVEGQVGEVLAALLAKWNGPRHSGEFRVESGPGGDHVIPVARQGLNGNRESYSSPLDARIDISKEERDGLEAIVVVARAIAERSGREVVPGTMPMNRLRKARVVVGSENQSAREILWAVIQAIDPALSWRVLCEVGENSMCAINIHRVDK